MSGPIKTTWILIVRYLSDDQWAIKDSEEFHFGQRVKAEREACKIARRHPNARFELEMDTTFNGRPIRMINRNRMPFTARPEKEEAT